jgi:hypothetical protein
VLLDILHLLVILIPISNWCFSLHHHLFDPTNRSRNKETFKVYYLRRIFAQAIAATEEDTDENLEGLQHL